LGVSRHAALLHYREDGLVRMAGAHEDIIIHRAAEGRVERLRTSGIWIGINDDISTETCDQSFELTPGDVLVLHTDGLIEARHAARVEFGVEGVERVLRDGAAEPVSVIHRNVLAAARSWAPVQQET
jgi:sigma-B regulation protein RsbU (phosphoserine phosphatase)